MSDIPSTSNFVQITGAQTVAGIKTFTSIPVLPASNPTTANQAVRKSYVDTTVSNKTDLKSNTDSRAVNTIPNDYNTKFDRPLLKANATLGIYWTRLTQLIRY